MSLKGTLLKNPSGIKILYAEDNPADAEMTLRAFKNQKLLSSVVWVKNGEEAIDYLFREGLFEGRAEGHPNLVLLDLKMPKVNGLEVLRRIRAAPELKFIPVVILTSSPDEIDIVRSYELGVNSYIAKPVNLGNFTETVKELGMYWILKNLNVP